MKNEKQKIWKKINQNEKLKWKTKNKKQKMKNKKLKIKNQKLKTETLSAF